MFETKFTLTEKSIRNIKQKREPEYTNVAGYFWCDNEGSTVDGKVHGMFDDMDARQEYLVVIINERKYVMLWSYEDNPKINPNLNKMLADHRLRFTLCTSLPITATAS